MGGTWSNLEPEPLPDPWWPPRPHPPSTHHATQEVGEENEGMDPDMPERGERGRVRQEELESFKQELARKRALRHEALATLQAELRDLRSTAEAERSLRLRAEQERDTLRSCSHEELRAELERERQKRAQISEELDKERQERTQLMEELEAKAELEKQVQALKDVSEIGKEMLRIRELQVKELKKKLVEINLSSVMAPPEDLRVEYEKQIDNIRKLRTLYEERAAATLLEHRREMERNEAKIEVLETQLSQLQKDADEVKETKDLLENKVETLESTIQHKDDELESTKDSLFSSVTQNKSLNSQMTLINNLFSQMLVSPKVDLDRLTRLLKDNHGLIRDMTESGDVNEVAALLVDLAGQVEKEESEEKPDNSSANDDDKKEVQAVIALNLSKVWRVMVELLSHHQRPSHCELAGGADSCYKCVQTPAGPRSVISVSQTFLTLKDLILEKNHLVKEVGRLKTLNNHLEHRLGSQEKRLSVVTTELRKTWGIVNKLRAQHKQLHTHEKILRYELQQKRCMLTELKDELEHCREKWDRARQKNTQTEEDWRNLRKEFAARKSRKESYSAESGYEEEDVAHSPTAEPNIGTDLVKLRSNDGSEPELSEEEIEHSDGNSFDTVIDLMDIIGLENQSEGEVEICEVGSPIVLSEVPLDASEVPPRLLPLSTSEFTQGLDQIESEDLAAILDTQYQNQLLGADYNLSLPSSSGSSPIPTENDGFASSEMEVSEEDSSSHENHIYSSPFPITNQTVKENSLLFGSNSANNISKFLDGLFEEQQNGNGINQPQSLTLNIPSTSLTHEDNGSSTPLVSSDSCYQFPADNKTPLVVNENCSEIPVQILKKETKSNEMEHVQQWVIDSQARSADNNDDDENACCAPTAGIIPTTSTECSTSPAKTQEEILIAREDRLRKLEKQCRSLVSTVMSNSFRSQIISSKLDELHLSYGSSEDASDMDEESHIKVKENKSSPYESEGMKPNSMTGQESIVTLNGEKTNTQEMHPASRNAQGRNVESNLGTKSTLKNLDDQYASQDSMMTAPSLRSDTISTLDTLCKGASSDYPRESNRFTPSEDYEPEPSTSHTYLAMTRPLADENVTNSHPENKVIPSLTNEADTNISPVILNEPTKTIDAKKNRTPEEILEARAERFKRLEEQCKSLVSKMTATSRRSEIISNKLDQLHSCHGSSEDASDGEEHSISRTGCRRRSTPTSSPRYNRKVTRAATDETAPQVVNCEEENTERVALPEILSGTTENQPQTMAESTDRTKRTPEEILQARAQRLDRLEEQCKSLFSKMSATSHRSDKLSNRLEELHGQYGQPTEHQATEVNRLGTDPDCETQRPQENELVHITSNDSSSEPSPPAVYDKGPKLKEDKNSD